MHLRSFSSATCALLEPASNLAPHLSHPPPARREPKQQVVNNTLAGEAYVLTQCGAEANDAPSELRSFSIPLTSVSLPETVPYAFLDLLGVTDRVYDVSEYVVAPCGQRLLQQCGRVAPDSLSLDNETLLATTIGPYTDGLVTSTNGEWPTQFTFSATTDPGETPRHKRGGRGSACCSPCLPPG